VRNHTRVLGALAIAVVAAVGGAVGWLVGGGGNPAEAASRVQYLAATAPQANAFTAVAEIEGQVTVEAAAPFGGSGSNLVCDRELLIKFLVAKPDRMRAWARVQAIEPTVAAVTRYIRSLVPSTLVTPTRVTNYSYSQGRAVPFQAVLGPGTAVLVDEQGAIRARCRCGNPLQDPVLSTDERCDGCPQGVQMPTAWRLGTVYYVVHPSPPPVEGEEPEDGDTNERLTVRVVKVLPGAYVVEETVTGPNGRTRVRTRTVPTPRTATTTRTRTQTRTREVDGPTVTITGPARTVFVPRTVTVERTVTQQQTVTVFTGEG